MSTFGTVGIVPLTVVDVVGQAISGSMSSARPAGPSGRRFARQRQKSKRGRGNEKRIYRQDAEEAEMLEAEVKAREERIWKMIGVLIGK